MIRLYITPLVLNFWASPHSSMALGSWRTLRAERNTLASLKALDPGFPRDDPPEQPVPRTVPPIPTDVPAPGPRDVPAPEPIDVPAPDPGGVPPVAEPPKPKPRPIP